MANVTMTAPWYTLVNQIKYTYGRSPYVKVNALETVSDGLYKLVINVISDEVAKALRQVIPLQFVFGNITVDVVVYNSKEEEVPVDNTAYTPETLAELFCTALKLNQLFKGAVVKPEAIPATIGNVILVIEKEIIQFFNDDISDICQNYNEVASKVFQEVTNPEFPVDLVARFSTFDPMCVYQRMIYCPKCNKKKICR